MLSKEVHSLVLIFLSKYNHICIIFSNIYLQIYIGVPFTAKESYAAAGMLHTLGIVSRMKCRAEEDAEAIKLMKDAGAILIAVSNVPELNKWFVDFIRIVVEKLVFQFVDTKLYTFSFQARN